MSFAEKYGQFLKHYQNAFKNKVNKVIGVRLDFWRLSPTDFGIELQNR